MSEYQYHEWQALDRLLTPDEQASVNRLSSHIEVSPSRAVVTYNWSSFRHDPKRVLLKYFDAYFYWANWGSLRLMFRFPQGLLDEVDIEPYLIYDSTVFETSEAYQVLDLDFNTEDGDEWDEWIEDRMDLSRFIPLRSDLIEGDYRLLYLAWLKAMEMDEPYDDDSGEDDPDSPIYDLEPPVPPGLKEISPSLQSFIDAVGIDSFLLQAAAEASPDRKKALGVDYHELVARLSRDECDDFLTRLAEGDPGVAFALRKRLGAFLPSERPQQSSRRTVKQLHDRAVQLKRVEKQRRAEAARRKHIADMKALAAREQQTWQEVDTMLETGRKTASVYDQATALLEKLAQLAEFQDTRDDFRARLGQLAQKYSSRPSLIARWRSRGWV